MLECLGVLAMVTADCDGDDQPGCRTAIQRAVRMPHCQCK